MIVLISFIIFDLFGIFPFSITINREKKKKEKIFDDRIILIFLLFFTDHHPEKTLRHVIKQRDFALNKTAVCTN